MNKITAVFAAAVIIISLVMSAAVSADDTLNINISDAAGAEGETVSVVLSVTDNPGFAYISIPLDNDESSLEFVSASGKGLSGWTIAKNAVWFSADDTFYTGDILTVKLRIREGASGDLSFKPADIECYDSSEKKIAVLAGSGKITVLSGSDNNSNGANSGSTDGREGTNTGSGASGSGSTVTDFIKNDGEWVLSGPDGSPDTSFSGLVADERGWWKVENGRIDFNFTGIAENSLGSWYIRNGKADLNYFGNVTYNGKTYNIIKGKAVLP